MIHRKCDQKLIGNTWRHLRTNASPSRPFLLHMCTEVGAGHCFARARGWWKMVSLPAILPPEHVVQSCRGQHCPFINKIKLRREQKQTLEKTSWPFTRRNCMWIPRFCWAQCSFGPHLCNLQCRVLVLTVGWFRVVHVVQRATEVYSRGQCTHGSSPSVSALQAAQFHHGPGRIACIDPCACASAVPQWSAARGLAEPQFTEITFNPIGPGASASSSCSAPLWPMPTEALRFKSLNWTLRTTRVTEIASRTFPMFTRRALTN